MPIIQQPSVSYSRARRFATFIAGAWAISGGADAAPIFDVSFDTSASVLTGTERDNITSHLQAAGRRWSSHLPIAGSPSIEIRVFISNVPTANGASATTVSIGTIGGRDTYEQGVANELRTGTDPNGTAPDANITIGLAYLRNELWFDPDPDARTAPVPVNRTDAMSTMLHEIGHTLAYNGWADLTTGAPTRAYWSIWDAYIQAGASPAFTGAAATEAWSGTHPALTIGNINHWGNSSTFRFDVAPARCAAAAIEWSEYAPVPSVCEVPQSVDRPTAPTTSAATVSPSLIDQLMNGVVFYRGTRYDISTLDLGVLIDVGLLNDYILVTGFDPPV